LLPSLMLKHGDTLFLDDKSVAELESRLGTQILPVAGVAELIETCLRQ
jgi:NifB/MoaA-like Fe-S oxidoreductase